MSQVGLETACLGFPAIGSRMEKDCLDCVRHIRDNRLSLSPTLVARTLVSDIQPILTICDESGIKSEVLLFLGVGYARQICENWDQKGLLKMVETAVKYAVGNCLQATFVIEDASRTHPDILKTFFLAALDAGATRLVLTDTVGAADPSGIRALVKFTRRLLDEKGFGEVGLDFHGHMDRGLGVINSLTAMAAGVDRIHGCGLGVGERSGNTPMEQLILNLDIMGYETRYDLTGLPHYCQTIAAGLKIVIPDDLPVVGKNAFRNNAGVHATAVLKAMKLGIPDLADQIYYCIPPGRVGRKLEIVIGPMSGRSNAEYWLMENHIPVTCERIDRIMARAKLSSRILSDEQIRGVIKYV